MGKRFVVGCVCGLVGYGIGLAGGIGLVSAMSSNTHDRSLEAAMTGAAVTGPLVALVAFILGFVIAKPKTKLS